MKYDERKFAKFIGGTGFFAILACCVLIIGAATWFAVSKFNDGKNQTEAVPKNNESYSSPSSAYDDITEDISSAADKLAEDVTGEVSSEPYTSVPKEAKPETITNKSFVFPVDGEICKNYSETELQYSQTYGDMRMHLGLDIACEKGASVMSIGNGEVVSFEEGTSMGSILTIDHGNGITAKYCSVENVTVKSGDKVHSGEIIGAVGTVTNECADQSHIHLEVLKNKQYISPLEILNDK